MGKASSSKKVARAARAAGSPGAGRQWGWPLAIVGLVVVGVLLIAVSRSANEESEPPIIGDHWHTAYGIYNCEAFIPPLSDTVQDTTGLHTHGDSLIHVHPFSTAYTGDRATVNAWGETVGFEITETSIDAPGIHVENGDECSDGPGTVQVMKWDSIGDEEGELLEGDPGDYAMQNNEILTFAFVAEGTEIPKPDEQVLATLQAPPDVTGEAPPEVIDPEGDATTSTEVPVPEGEVDADAGAGAEGETGEPDSTTPAGTTDTTAAGAEDTTPTTAAP